MPRVRYKIAVLLFFLSYSLLGEEKQDNTVSSIVANDVTALNESLNKGFDVNLTLQSGKTALIIAASSSNIEIVKALLNAGADVNKKSADGLTPLDVANNPEIAELLGKRGAKRSGSAASLWHAIYSENSILAKNAIQAGADPKIVAENGETIMHVIARWKKDNDACNLIKWLSAKGVNENTESKKGLTALDYASTERIAKALKEAGVAHGKSEWALVVAVESGNEPRVQEFVGTLKKDDLERFHGGKALFEACEREMRKTIHILLDAGVNPSLYRYRGTSALHLICDYNKPDIELAKKLIRHGADVNAIDEGGITPLHRAVLWDDELVQLLLENGAKPNSADRNGETSLHLLCKSISTKKAKRLEFLLKSGADINFKNKQGESPLLCAVKGRDVEMVESLVKFGADQSARDISGEDAVGIVNGRNPMVKEDMAILQILKQKKGR